MQGLGAGIAGNGDQTVDVEIAVLLADVPGLVSLPNMPGLPVRSGVDGD